MRIRTGITLALLLALSLAGCGGDGSADGDGLATAGGSGASPTAVGKPGPGNEREQMLRFAQCMRENGVPEFPDPQFNDGGGVSIGLPEGTDARKVEAAQQKCKQHLPNGGEAEKIDPERLEQLRKYSQCMRENGIPNFPDPTDGGLKINNNDLGLEPNDPRFEAANQKCDKYLPAPPSGAPSPRLQTGGNG